MADNAFDLRGNLVILNNGTEFAAMIINQIRDRSATINLKIRRVVETAPRPLVPMPQSE